MLVLVIGAATKMQQAIDNRSRKAQTTPEKVGLPTEVSDADERLHSGHPDTREARQVNTGTPATEQ